MNTMTKKVKKQKNLLQHIFNEIRLLRSEVTLFMPDENLNGYAHPSRIKKSFERALRQYPRTI
ncbi:MAG: hypothetical protein UT65_C0015G0017 [Parcubacteria group bacterium GW2011_GWF2_39_8b]|uniref:Uncharacterized protein n=3 Tax=Candidatus Zambryskiibacteriota TaxID=1817925 RepID=A0A1G2TJM1_9BACT|nr:MAG: hypothetical protein UT65_C0015G0017 [Parcubacteria group bacterium GW2011_GWF2_39_8b]KKR46222.1 MAG: hypothetical protein UT81_C0001G0069 [Parcubacteria group bacterium GW2011_GWA2_40_14]OHA97278.1 MAG: hypothetical protein A3E32_02255 [Candidatus Zambryskibacteria bacterium RIFCSPHIGHO2_12_FULL_38_37]OHB08101.1 MAG: hypothetical protein A2W64_03140 [Candidatus Zambryskibacteria bacterium RIFCSPLOWO2_02_39_10]OHB10599.1 MAG: hypothetical protein A3I21_00940 [Candidatus Zambryskibacteri